MVKTSTLDKVINMVNLENINLIKYDIEGAEREVFASVSKFSDGQYLLGKFNSQIEGLSFESIINKWSDFSLIFCWEYVILMKNNSI
jgi:hypothetical protein